MTKQTGQGPRYTDSDYLVKKLATGIPGILSTYWLSADGKSHRFLFVSDQVQNILGINAGGLRENAAAMFSTIHPDDVAGVYASIAESALALTPWWYQARLKVKAGHFEWFESHSSPERQADGSTIWYGHVHNI